MNPQRTVHVRVDLTFDIEPLVKKFCKKHFSAYVYGMEKAKITEKEHFHITGKSAYHIDTIRRNAQTMFKVSKSQLSVKTVRKLINMLAYTIKDDKYYFVNWPKEEIEQAKQHKLEVQAEQKLKNLSDKCIAYLKTLDNSWHMQNTDLMFAILKWFKKKDLNYPAPHWMKSTMIKFYMEQPTKDINRQNIEALYGIRNAYIGEKTI